MASLVLKVKYEETLRRFNVAINGDRRLDLSMEGLRVKICSLFNLPSDSQFCLTYKDEDDDLVTLVNDGDLHDVVRQGLDPVRITVHLISDQKPQSSSARSGGSSLNHNDIKSANSAMKSSGPSKVGVSHENAILSNSGVGNSTKPSSEGMKHEGVKPDGIEKRSQATGVGVSVKPASSPSFPLCSSYKYKTGRENKNKDDLPLERKFVNNLLRSEKELTSNAANRAAGFQSYPAPACDQFFKPVHQPNINLNNSYNMTSVVHAGITCGSCGLRPISGPRFMSKVRYNYDLCHGCFLRVGNEMDYYRIDYPFGYILPQPVIKAFDADNSGSIFHNGITCKGCGVLPISGPRFKSKVKYNHDLCWICFSQMGYNLEYARIDIPLTYSHLDRAPDVDHLGVVIHNGVTCNGCGVLPIRGARFKSKVSYDYDLCSTCLTWMGDAKDYIKITRIDSPMAYKPLPYYGVLDVKSPCPYIAGPWEYPALKLDSCFVKHVTIPDGTTMAPLTPFTKIWRMRNNGTIAWFPGVRLTWVGGDRFSTSDSVEIQVPAYLMGSGQEINIAVDFVAPEIPGQYTSFWRMVSGQKFGQQVSVHIQVDPSVDLIYEIFRPLDLNLPPSSRNTVFPEIVKAEPGLDIEVTNSSAPSIVEQNRKIQMIALNLEINDDLPPAAHANGPGSPVGPSSVSYPGADASSYSIPEGSTPIQSDPTSDNCGEHLPSAVSYPEAEADASSDSIPEGSTPTRPDPTSDNYGGPLLSSVTYPEADASSYSIPEASTPVQSDPTSDSYGEFFTGTMDENINFELVTENTETEEKLMKALKQIGFKQIDLDEEVDSGRSVDDHLSDGSDWDPILEELTEMGFENKDANKKLLAKNNGSITRAVMDLTAEEKA